MILIKICNASYPIVCSNSDRLDIINAESPSLHSWETQICKSVSDCPHKIMVELNHKDIQNLISFNE